MINAFLSYRHRNPTAIQARDCLKQLCLDSEEITLLYDEDVTKEGDNLIHFMEDLVDARCVFIFIDPDYFHSSYTLFELISISEQVGFDKRFVHPVRLSEDMVTYSRTDAKTFWDDDNNERIRVELGRLLEKTNRLNSHAIDDFDAMWERVEEAWAKLVTGYLDELHPAISQDNPSEVLQTRLNTVIPAVNEVKQELHDSLLSHVSKQIKTILNRKHIPLVQLAGKLKDPEHLLKSSASGEDIAAYITKTGNELSNTMSALVQVMQQQKEALKSKEDQWHDCFYDAEQLVGWLLLLSVDADWWFENQNILEKDASDQVLNELYLEDNNFIEVVISRGLLVKAGYRLDEYGGVEPSRKQNDIGMLYDATSEGSKDLQSLSAIFKDLFPTSSRLPPAARGKSQVDVMLDKIQRRAKIYKQNADGKAIYYLISSEAKANLTKLDWYKKAQSSLKGYIRFICCETEKKSYGNPASVEDATDLLEQVAILLAMNSIRPETD